MGFKLTDRVYRYVKNTTSTQQAVLAYLAFRADDRSGGSCYPSIEAIAADTHFKISAIKNALNALKKLGLIGWVSGGRAKGGGGRAFANDYSFNLPDRELPSSSHQMASAVATKWPMHRPSSGQCSSHQMATIIHSNPINQPSVIQGTDGEDVDEELARKAVNLAGKFKADQAKSAGSARTMPARDISPVAEAMRICGVGDADNMRVFSKIMSRKDFDACREVVWCFESEMRQGEHSKLRNPAARLTQLLQALPDVR